MFPLSFLSLFYLSRIKKGKKIIKDAYCKTNEKDSRIGIDLFI